MGTWLLKLDPTILLEDQLGKIHKIHLLVVCMGNPSIGKQGQVKRAVKKIVITGLSKKNKTDHANDIDLSQPIFLTFQQALYDLYVSFLLCPELTVVSEFKKTNYLPNDGKEDRVQSWLFRFEQRDNTVDFVFANFLRDAGQLSMQFFPAFIFNSVDSTRLS